MAVNSRRYSSPRRACASFPAARGFTGTLVQGTRPHCGRASLRSAGRQPGYTSASPLNLCVFPRKTRWHRFAPGEWVGLISGIPLPLSQTILCREAIWGLAPQPSPTSTRPSGARGDLLKASSVLENRSVCSLARHGPAQARLLPTGATQLTPRVAVNSRRYSSLWRACASYPPHFKRALPCRPISPCVHRPRIFRLGEFTLRSDGQSEARHSLPSSLFVGRGHEVLS